MKGSRKGLRNFWITGGCTGRETDVAFGPTGDKGSFSLDIFMAENGQSVRVVRVVGITLDNGAPQITVDCSGQGLVYSKIAEAPKL